MHRHIPYKIRAAYYSWGIVFCDIPGMHLPCEETGVVCSMRLPDALREDPFMRSGYVGSNYGLKIII